jgi:hypothetical protein
MNLNALKTNQTPASRGQYVVVKGFNYGPDDTRVNEGVLLSEKDLPADVFTSLLNAGAIQPKEIEVK